jgi:hypothetical protein
MKPITEDEAIYLRGEARLALCALLTITKNCESLSEHLKNMCVNLSEKIDG